MVLVALGTRFMSPFMSMVRPVMRMFACRVDVEEVAAPLRR